MEALQWIFSTGINIGEAIQLNAELEGLRVTLPKARFLINRGEWGRFKNKDLAELLSHLKDTTYDAEDLLRELDDQVLRQQRQDAGRSWAGQLLSSSLTLAKRFIYGSKKRVKEIQDKLKNSMDEVEGVLSLMGLNVEPAERLMPETSSLISAPEVFGRDSEREVLMDKLGVMIEREDERDQVMKQLGVPLTRSAKSNGKRTKEAADNGGASTSRPAKRPKGQSRDGAGLADINYSSNKVSVIPIVGIGGVGKTTLAQVIYNDSRVKRHFGVRIWVCVSDVFDKKRMTKEIVESISGEEFNGPCSFNALREELQEQLKRRKFLLVLDDIWPNANSHWEEFYAPLRQGFEGSMILVTTRYPKVADHIRTSNCQPVQLGGLPDDIFWEFFRKCAFEDRELESYPELQVIGKNIFSRLCGSPLAAKTLGRLLSMELTVEHWRTVQNSELWQLQHEDNEILPALQLSYLYLPQEHKRCFAFCSMFPKDYSFQRHELVDIWMAEGFLVPKGTERLEDVGMGYLDELRSRFLFQTDPKFPNQNRYVMHDLIHDMAQSVSVNECFLLQDSSHADQRRVPQTVRHMSVMVDDESLSREIQQLKKLRSLRLQPRFNVEITYFNQLTNILFLSLKGCKLEKLHESICELGSLRYLDISHSRVRELPEKFWRLCSLQVLDATRSSLQTVHQDVTKLINLRLLALPSKAYGALETVSGIGNLSSLRNLRQFTIRKKNGWRIGELKGKKNGWRIGELKGMNQLSGTLTILELRHVQSKEEASEARLADKQYVNVLDLRWGRWARNANDVVEGLRPHPRIEHLKVSNFDGDLFPSWFNPQDLPNLKSLELCVCSGLKSTADGTLARQNHASGSISCSSFSHLTTLRVYCCTELTDLGQFLSPENLPSLRSMKLEECHGLVSIAAHNFVGFVFLQDLVIYGCHKLVCPREMVLPPSLRRLTIGRCGVLERSFPACLENLTSLRVLKLIGCDNVKFIPLSSIPSTKTLKYLRLHNCKELSSIEAPHCLSSIQYVEISQCPKLTEVEQPFETNRLTKEEKELLESW
ncbi:hypothetical protein EJB05_10129, partial [Eragrostis curvula]